MNCQQEVDGNYCSHCGQSTTIPPLTFKLILSDFFSSAFNWEGPFYNTFFALFQSPARLFKEYIVGSRKKYYSPVKYLLLCLLIFITIELLTGYDPVEIANQLRNDETTYTEQGTATSKFILNYINYFSLLLPFTFAVLSKLFFWNYPYNLAERTAFGFFVAGHYMLINLIPLFLSFVQPALIQVRYLLTILYFAYVFYKLFLKDSKVKTFIKSIFAAILTMILYFALTYLLALLILSFR